MTHKKLILDTLRAGGHTGIIKKIKSVKVSRYSGGSSLNVETIDLYAAERAILEPLVGSFQYGDFDGMIDLYEYRKGHTMGEHSVKYAFLGNEWSPETMTKIVQILRDQWDIVDDETAQAKMSCWYDNAKYRIGAKLGTEYPV